MRRRSFPLSLFGEIVILRNAVIHKSIHHPMPEGFNGRVQLQQPARHDGGGLLMVY